MDIHRLSEDLQDVSDQYAERYGIKRTPDWHVMKLSEELGELIQSYLKVSGQARTGGQKPEEFREAFEDELADVIGMALLLAKDQDVDLEQAFRRKWLVYHDAPRSVED